MNNKQKLQDAKKELLALIQQDNAMETIAEHLILIDDSEFPSSEWSALNKMILAANEEAVAAGYRQWEKLGRNVKKGATALHIFAPVIVKDKEKNKEKDPDEEPETKLVGFRQIPVFGYSQTEGEEHQIEVEPVDPPALLDVVEELADEVNYKPFTGKAAGYYNPKNNSITLCSHTEKILWHELGHLLHYQVRDVQPSKGQDPEKEIIAETVAGVLAVIYDEKEFIPNVKQYIDHYSKEEEAAEAVSRVFPIVEDCLDLLFSVKEKQAAA